MTDRTGEPRYSLRVNSPLTPEEDAVVGDVLRCAVRVHRGLGPGLLEHLYRRALCLELDSEGISFLTECTVAVHYKDRLLGMQRLDLLVDGRVVVELKSVERLEPIHSAQLLSYLRAARLRAGLLLNFNAPRLVIRRLVL